MGKLIYLTPASLDGFIGDGDYEWSAPFAEEIKTVLNAGMAEVGTYLYGRRTYETMAVWETDPTIVEYSPESAGFAAMWQKADKVVFSSTLTEVPTQRTRLEKQLDAQLVRDVKAASRGDLTVGGPSLAGEALRLDLVDVVELLWCPILLGGGIPVLTAGVRRELRLQSEQRLGNGVVHATYEVVRH